MRVAARLALVVVATALQAHLATAEPRWPSPDPAYTFMPAPGCDRPRTASLRDVCADQMALFSAARAQAAAQGKSLLVVFGATWCPSCKGLTTALPEALVLGGQADRLHVVEITISTVVAGKISSVPSGEAVRADLMRARPDFRQRAIPFVALVDPKSGRTSARNLDDLEQSGAWNRTSLARVLTLADAEVRGGQTAPAEPAWLTRKWTRWFGD